MFWGKPSPPAGSLQSVGRARMNLKSGHHVRYIALTRLTAFEHSAPGVNLVLQGLYIFTFRLVRKVASKRKMRAF